MAAMPGSSHRLQPPKHSTHPRRPPAQASVSLRHALASKRANKGSDSTSSSGRLERTSSDGDESPSSLKPHMGKDSSGESSNAEHWFDKSNNQVRETGSLGDSEPPFFMRNSSSLETPPEGQKQLSHEGQVSDSLPLRAELLHLGTDGSGTDEFRNIIDDLTVQNKKLKRRLKKYEKLHDAHLKDDKLFEVRVHGLPPEKKRELEDMLRKFVSSLDTTGENAFPTDGYNSLLPMLNKEASNATAQQTDSAYASMSLSGPGSSAVSGSDSKPKVTPRGHLTARQKNIHSYLHDIPNGLLPRTAPANMSERAKKKLVVRKMEQLFVGKGAVGGHQQPLQQQEVSLSAAQADRSAMAAAGQSARAYGAREAQMIGGKRADGSQGMSSEHVRSPRQPVARQPSGKDKEGSRPDTEQRPTQPIDLDPDRAQVPRENIQYMRSMGFSPQHPDVAPEEGHGWIYINFLFNMAQLHTLHVTTDFVRDAMAEISKKLEVSPDGRKVRWRGGRSVTRTSSLGESTPDTGNSSEAHDGQSPRKRLKMVHGNASNRSSAQAMGGASARMHESNKHVYTPMFHHKDGMDDSDDSSSEEEDTNEESDQRWDTIGNDSSGRTSSGVQPSTRFNIAGQKRKKLKRDDGPIIFYNNARFCTDLSGERRPMANTNVPSYNTFAAHPIGDKGQLASSDAGRGPLADAGSLPEAMDLDDNPTDSSQELTFAPFSPPGSAYGQKDQEPRELEVTGIGGVWPEDNFTLNVETRHARVAVNVDADRLPPTAPKSLPPRFAALLASAASTSSAPNMGHEVTDVEVQRHAPSRLPPALGFMEHDDDDDTSSDASDAYSSNESPDPHEPDRLPPQVSTQPLDFGYHYSSSAASSSDEDDPPSDDEEDEEEDDGEMDLLADIRQRHPEFVRAQEREYDANMAERLAEEIPAGSSAATAGGGSGFNSPASVRESVRMARRAQGVDVGGGDGGLRREGTGDSMEVEGLEGSEAGDDGEGESGGSGGSDGRS